MKIKIFCFVVLVQGTAPRHLNFYSVFDKDLLHKTTVSRSFSEFPILPANIARMGAV